MSEEKKTEQKQKETKELFDAGQAITVASNVAKAAITAYGAYQFGKKCGETVKKVVNKNSKGKIETK